MRLVEWEGRMIRWAMPGVRIGLVVAAMAVIVPMITFAQTPESTIESVPAEAEAAEVNTRPTGNDTPAQADPSSRSAISVEVEIQRHINELRSELLDDRADYIDRWLIAVTIVLAFFGILGFRRFREIEAEARKSVEAAKRYEADAKDHAERIEALQGKAVADVQRIRNLTSEAAAHDPTKANLTIKDIFENPRASLTDKVIAAALDLQQQGRNKEAIEKWQIIASIAEGTDNGLAARALLSVGYLLQERDLKSSISAYNEALRLKPDYTEAYTNRGNAKGALGRHEDALADYNEVIRLKPDLALAYSNRGNAKGALGRHEDALADYNEALRLEPDLALAYSNRGNAKGALGRHEDALADYNEAIRLKPDYAEAYTNRGNAKAALGKYEEAITDYNEAIRLEPDHAGAYSNRGKVKAVVGLKDEAQKDFEIGLELARNANNVNMVAQVEQSLLDLDAAEGS